MRETPAQPAELQAGPLRLPLLPSPRGPELDEGGEYGERLASLAWVLGVSARPDLEEDEVFAATQGGAPYFDHVLEIRPPGPDDDLDGARRVWRELTSTELAGELRLLQVASSEPFVLPLEVLREITLRLRRLRAEHRHEPPWLFTPDAVWGYPAPAERLAIADLERRLESAGAVEGPELAAAGLRCEAQHEAKLGAMLEWDAPSLARDYAGFLHERGVVDGAPWLFRESPVGELPHPEERAQLVELEREAAAIDREEASLGGGPDPPGRIRRRAALLEVLEAHGLLSESLWTARSQWLARWRLEALANLHTAAKAAWVYQRSEARRSYLADAPVTPLRSLPVCLDLFRPGAIRPPEGVLAAAWISWGEYLLRTHGPGPDVLADQGDFPYHDQDGLITVLWRRDAGLPALRYLSLQAAR